MFTRSVSLERTPNNYIIRILHGSKVKEVVTYNNIEDVLAWFRCLPHMRELSKAVRRAGTRLLQQQIVYQYYSWKEEDEHYRRVQQLFPHRGW